MAQRDQMNRYFQKKPSKANYSIDIDGTAVKSLAYGETMLESPVQPQADTPLQVEAQVLPSQRLILNGQMLFYIMSGIVLALMMFVNLFLQLQTHYIQETIKEYDQQGQLVKEEMDGMVNEIAHTYDYQSIKSFAESKGMNQDRARVEDIE